MKSSCFRRRASTIVSVALVTAIFSSPLRAQQPSPPPPQQPAATAPEPTFDTLLSADSYKLYAEVRNVGQLLTTGGAGEIIDPIIKLADPGPQLKSLVKFLRDNSEALAASRLMLATWPARTDLPTMFAAIEFATPEEAAKFTPKLETFLPTVLPPVPVEEPKSESPPQQADAKTEASPAKPNDPKTKVAPPAAAKPSASPAQPATRSPFVISHSGSLVFISDRAFKVDKLHPRGRALLGEDNKFRVARDRFSSEPVFLFFNVALEDKTAPKPSPTPVISEEERERLEREQQAEIEKLAEDPKEPEKPAEGVAVDVTVEGPKVTAVLGAGPSPSPTPPPTKEQQAQATASNQIGSMLNMLGQGPPKWPEAIGVALALDNEEYVVRAILIEKENTKRVLVPFVPQLVSGPTMTSEAASILPDDTEVFVSASIDFARTYQEMRKQAEANVKQAKFIGAGAEARIDHFADFEKKAGLKISDDLMPVLGNELAVAASLKMANMANIVGVPMPPAPKSSTDPNADKNKPQPLPIFLVAIKDRDAARRLIPRVLGGLGIGEANLLAQTERRGDSEIVSYAGIVSYAFIGNFLVISDSATVRNVADASTNGATLSSNNAFRSSRHWQPRNALGEVYISPALMEGYQEQIGKQSSTMDQAMRDFLMKLSPKASAITYALSHDGLGALHELHLPKNLILAMVAGTSSAMQAMKEGSPEMNEMIAIGVLQMIANGEENYKTTAGNGSYGSIDDLIEHKMLAKDVLDKYGYRFQITTSSNGFEAVATPIEYGKTGKRSFFVDQTGVVRGDDHGGGPATSADKPVNQ